MGAILLSVFTHSLPASAQKSAIPPNMVQGNSNKRIIAGQLRLAAKLGRKAMAGFEATPRDNAIPIDQDTIQAAQDTYALIRAARHGMELLFETQKVRDPVDQLTFKKLDEAWNASRYPIDRLSWGIPREKYLSESLQGLSRAMQLVDQALVFLPG
ncbi:MAG: hypothetical protein ACRD0Q_08805 [Acidimicrobiales bacterium]